MSRNLIKLLEHLPQNRLPTCLQVVQRFECIRTNHREEGISMSVDRLIQEIIDIWNKAYIPVMNERNIKRKLYDSKKSLINRYNSMKRHPERMKLSSFEVLFDIKSDSGKFRNEVDRLFYLDQNNKRIATIGPIDILDNKKIQSNKERYSREILEEKSKEARQMGKRKLQLDAVEKPISEKRQHYTGKYDDNFSSDENEPGNDPEWVEDISKRTKFYRAKSDSNNVNISIDKDTFLDNIALIADRTFTSSRKAVQIAAAAFSTGSEKSEISRLTISHSSLHRKRDNLRISNDKLITENWRKKKEDTLFLLHWDEKTLRHLRQVDGSNAYMAVVLTDLFTGEEKILSIVEMSNSKAEEGASSVIKALEEWNINKKNIIGCVFDTTNTNSGWKTGIVVRLEEFLEQRVIHVYCRHHVLERMANDVVHVYLGESTSPDELTYRFLIDNWNELDLNDKEEIDIDRRTHALLEDVKAFAIKMQELDFRDDYQEVVNLTLILLGSFPENLDSYTVRPPGSISHTRWMAKILCEFKIVLFSSQLIKLGLITKDEAFSHKQFTLFLILYYVKSWMTATLSIDAPVNDLWLANTLKNIPSHLLCKYPLFKSMGVAMKSKLEDHLWYLSEELVVLSLFSKKMDEAQKNKCRKAMLKHYTENLSPVKGKLITPDISNKNSIEISTLFGKESWRLLHLCRIEGKSFLAKPPSSWENDSDYKILKHIVKNFVVVNDVAERAVLLAKSLQNKLTKDSKMKNRLVNLISELRKICKPNKKVDLFMDLNSHLRNLYNEDSL